MFQSLGSAQQNLIPLVSSVLEAPTAFCHPAVISSVAQIHVVNYAWAWRHQLTFEPLNS